MTRQTIIERTIHVINQLPEEKAIEISDFADFIFKQYEEYRLTSALQQLSSKSDAFEFLNQDLDEYSVSDLKIIYNE